MAAQSVREWTGIQKFPAATQTKLLELLGKLKQEVWSNYFTFQHFFDHEKLFWVIIECALITFFICNLLVVACGFFDYPCTGERRCWEIINCEFRHW